jgi:transcriptional regulator with XRE-family HTH domain
MKTINQRLKSIFESKKLKVNQVAAELEIDYRQFNNWLNQTKPSIDGLQKILKYLPDIDARWLLTGERQSEISSEEIPEMLEEAAAKYKTDCCRRCKDLENQIQLYEKLIAVYENPPKKETHDESGASSGEDTKRNKAV